MQALSSEVSPESPFRAMTLDDVAAAARVFARAFFDDPIAHYVTPSESTRFRTLEAVLRPFLRYGVLYGEVHTTPGEPAAGAIWLGPDEWHIGEEGASRAGMDWIADEIGDEDYLRFTAYYDWMSKQHELLAPATHLYLAVLAVDTHLQGQGIGSGLIRNMTRRADEEGLVCYLETQQPKNVPLYQRHGFEVVLDTMEPVSRLRTWAFVRQPQLSK